MVKLNGALCRASMAVVTFVALCGPAQTQPRPEVPAALGRLQRGLWELRDLDDARVRFPRICLGTPYRLVQIRHSRPGCTRTVVSHDAQSVTVHYTCPGAGYGQTVVRVETPRLAQIDTQGILGATPFAHRAEARRVGECAMRRPSRGR